MAINPGTLFVGKIDNTDLLNYPFGKAQNITSPSDGTGTPWVADNLNDEFGFHQALLSYVGASPTGLPETAQASQYLDALITIGTDLTRVDLDPSASTSVSYSSSDHGSYDELTAGSPITVTALAPSAPYGDLIYFERGTSTVSVVGDGGVTVETIDGGTFDLDTDGQVGALLSKGPNLWKFIK